MRNIKPIFILFILLILVLPACSPSRVPTGDEPETVSCISIDEAIGSDTSPESTPVQDNIKKQWAFEAEASSEYANPEWSASQATGAYDTTRCGDYQTAWATAGSDSEEWLELKFPVAVYVTGVDIYQSFNPDQVVKVELIAPLDQAEIIYTGVPTQVDQPCPCVLQVRSDKTEERYDTVRITIDQSVLGLGWNQIDAVQLIGETQ
jgi:hypothetical protein